MKTFKYTIAMLLVALMVASCSTRGESQTRENGSGTDVFRSGPEKRSLKILTSSKIIFDMIETISDGQHKVTYLTQNEEEIKTIQPDSQLVADGGYDAFFYIGAGYEPFIRDFTKGIDKNKVNVVNLSRGIDILRHKLNKIDVENYYYLMNSTNFKIALNSIKNSLQEMDPANKVAYDERFVTMSKRIDIFQSDVKKFMEDQGQLVCLTDSDWPAYVVADYHKDYQLISEFAERKALENNAEGSTTSTSETISSTRKFIFLYSDEMSFQKYSDDIVKYSLIPVKIDLYTTERSVVDNFRNNFDKIRDAIYLVN